MVPAIYRGDSQIQAKVRDAPAGLLFAHLRGRRFRQKLTGGVDASSAGRDRDVALRCAEWTTTRRAAVGRPFPVALSSALHCPTPAPLADVIGASQLFGLPQSPRGYLYLQFPDRCLASMRRQRWDPDNAASFGRWDWCPGAMLSAAAEPVAGHHAACGERIRLLDVWKMGHARYSPASRRGGS